jgi:membrane fusion protein, heavy metal efflux system
MTRPVPLAVLFAVLLALLLLSACQSPPAEHSHGDHDDHGDHAEEEKRKGPHGGRLLRSGDFALEVTIFEDGVPPEFRLYPRLRGEPVALDEVSVTLALTRINGLPGGQVDRHTFAPDGDALRSPDAVYEPHSFDVTVRAEYAGEIYEWTYKSPEGRVEIAADMAAASGLQTTTVGAGTIHERLALYGRIRPDPARVRAVSARFPGLAQTVSVQVGDAVKVGQTLATVESNESLQMYRVVAPLDGVVTARAINPGESVGASRIFEVADFSSVWAEVSVFPRDRLRLQRGQAVTLSASDGTARSEGLIDYVAPVGSDHQAVTARVVLDNADGRWIPGQFVGAAVTVGESTAEIVVPLSALQRFRDWDVVFVNEGETYQALPVQLGLRDDAQVEVRSGLESGARVVTENAFLVKADIEKSGASHDH